MPTEEIVKVSPQARRVFEYLRFERKSNLPCFAPEIKSELGIVLTASLISEGERTGLFRFSPTLGGYV